MGTRHITAVFVDGNYRVAQYGQWDGYPTGQGATIQALFSRSDFDLEHFRSRVRQCTWLNDDQIEMIHRKIDQYGGFKEAGYGHLSRDIGAGVLDFIYDTDGPVGLNNQLPFVGDSLMCEWAYVIDLDKGVLEVFTGFNQKPLDPSERFFEFTIVAQHRPPDDQFYPCRLVGTIPLEEVATFDMGLIQSKVEKSEAESDAVDAT